MGDTAAGRYVYAVSINPPLILPYREDDTMPILPYNQNLKEISKDLRKRLTEAEKHLWERLKNKHLGYIFYRQKPIGDYIVDFYCNQAKLVVEVDGGYHLANEAAGNDRVRNEYMKNLGLTVLRFNNKEVLENVDTVVTKIKEHLDKSASILPYREDDPSGYNVGHISF
jgi:very-short-patch-repair endonuclease